MLLPAAARHLTLMKTAGLQSPVAEISPLIDELIEGIKTLETANLEENQPHEDLLAHAKYIHDTVIPAMSAVREAADKLEKIVADDLWPLPKYSEVLFIK
jgi:glutamine synthetase